MFFLQKIAFYLSNLIEKQVVLISLGVELYFLDPYYETLAMF
jgi:hypothetical protein